MSARETEAPDISPEPRGTPNASVPASQARRQECRRSLGNAFVLFVSSWFIKDSMLKQELPAGHQRPEQVLDRGALFFRRRFRKQLHQPLAFFRGRRA